MQPVLVSAEGALEASESELCPSSSQLSGRPRLLTATPTSSTTRADKPTESAFWSCRISPEREYDDSNDRRPPVIAAAASRTSPSTRVRPVHDIACHPVGDHVPRPENAMRPEALSNRMRGSVARPRRPKVRRVAGFPPAATRHRVH
jgi:hypothetical protein